METKTLKSPDYNSINPLLKAAISSLDLDLESELSRYRRLKNKDVSQSHYNSSLPKFTPMEAFGLTAVGSLVHQPEEELSHQTKEDLSGAEDYFESSARLLSNLNKYDSLQGEDLLFLTPVKTPWGISSLFLFILGSFFLSLAFIPQELWANVPVINNLLVTESISDKNLPTSQVSETQKNTEISNFNNQDFLKININNLSTLNLKKEAPSNLQKNKSEVPVLSENKTSEKPSLPPTTPNENLTSALLPSVTNQIQSSPISSQQLNKAYYYVFSDFENPNSLISARQVIKDAYLVQFSTGKKIQFGAFVNQNDAQILVQRLKNQGISASVFRP